MGTFGRLVFCVVGTQLVGKTQFFDRLKSHFLFHLLELILDSGIFCAADAHFTKERVTALNDVFRHKNSLARDGETSIYNLEKQQEKNRLFMVFT